MTDVLENERNIWQPNLRSQKVVMIILQFLVSVMIPPITRINNTLIKPGHSNEDIIKNLRARITIQQCLRFDHLLPIFTSLAFKRIVCIT